MNKKLLIVVLIMAAFMLAGCAAETPAADAPAETEIPAAEPTEEAAAEPAYTVPENDMGLKNATIGELQELVSGGKSFYLYVAGSEVVPYDYAAIKEGFSMLQKDHTIPVDIYYTDETILTEEEMAALKELLGVEPTTVAAGEGAEGVSTYAGMYAFENGALKNTSYNFVAVDEKSKVYYKVINFIFESNLFVNDHGWDIVTYEQLIEKINSGEKFMVYISRDTCPFCVPFAKSLVAATENVSLNIPLYYFYTQPFKTAINNGEEGAQEAWDNAKATVGFEFTPSLIVFEDGKISIAFEGGIGSEYFEMTDEEKQAKRDEVTESLNKWFAENSFIAE